MAETAVATGRSDRPHMQALLLGALGVVYGDIGTSPLYAFKQSLGDLGALTGPGVLGVLSLIAWALFLVVTVKYVLAIMRADNRGEGGILALTALALRAGSGRAGYRWIMLAGMIGAALFYGDGVVTPAISVLSAVEGLDVATPLFHPYIVPIALVLLIGLFMVQRRGTARVGRLFGPVMLVWFIVLALLGLIQILAHPGVLLALDPRYGIDLLAAAPVRGFILLGSVVLAVTGAEALYADMGHFGYYPIKLDWLYLVFPALLLNYFGQGALVLATPASAANPFYLMAPGWMLYPMVALSSAATIIASQAVISGAFSMSRQAVQLGYLPRLRVEHTSEAEIGQVFVPRVNTGLMIAVVLLVLGFQSSDALGAAYGIAVTGTMSLTSALAFVYFRRVVGWSLAKAGLMFGGFLIVDLAFFSANMLKLFEGGWFPLGVAAIVGTIMSTWWEGKSVAAAQRAHDALPIDNFANRCTSGRVQRIPGTAIFVTGTIHQVPNALLHALKHFKSLHERVILLTVHTEDVPHVPASERIEHRELGNGFHSIRLHYGFTDQPDVPKALAECPCNPPLAIDWMETSVIVGREKVLAIGPSKMWNWRKHLFILLRDLSLDATEFLHIPPNRVVELGGQIEI